MDGHDKQNEKPETIYAKELFIQLSEYSQREIIDQIKSLLSEK